MAWSVSGVAGGGTLLCSVCPVPLSPFILPGPQPRSDPTRKKVNWFPPSRELLTFFFVLTLETSDPEHTAPHITWGGLYFSHSPLGFYDGVIENISTADETTCRLQKVCGAWTDNCDPQSSDMQHPPHDTVSTAALLNHRARGRRVWP